MKQPKKQERDLPGQLLFSLKTEGRSAPDLEGSYYRFGGGFYHKRGGHYKGTEKLSFLSPDFGPVMHREGTWWASDYFILRGTPPENAKDKIKAIKPEIALKNLQESMIPGFAAKLFYYYVDTPDLGMGVSENPIPDREWEARADGGAKVVFSFSTGPEMYYCVYRQALLRFLLKSAKGPVSYRVSGRSGLLEITDGEGFLAFLMPIRLRKSYGEGGLYGEKHDTFLGKPPLLELAKDAGLI